MLTPANNRNRDQVPPPTPPVKLPPELPEKDQAQPKSLTDRQTYQEIFNTILAESLDTSPDATRRLAAREDAILLTHSDFLTTEQREKLPLILASRDAARKRLAITEEILNASQATPPDEPGQEIDRTA